MNKERIAHFAWKIYLFFGWCIVGVSFYYFNEIYIDKVKGLSPQDLIVFAHISFLFSVKIKHFKYGNESSELRQLYFLVVLSTVGAMLIYDELNNLGQYLIYFLPIFLMNLMIMKPAMTKQEEN